MHTVELQSHMLMHVVNLSEIKLTACCQHPLDLLEKVWSISATQREAIIPTTQPHTDQTTLTAYTHTHTHTHGSQLCPEVDT